MKLITIPYIINCVANIHISTGEEQFLFNNLRITRNPSNNLPIIPSELLSGAVRELLKDTFNNATSGIYFLRGELLSFYTYDKNNRLYNLTTNSVIEALKEVSKKWTQTIRNCILVLNQILTIFEYRTQV